VVIPFASDLIGIILQKFNDVNVLQGILDSLIVEKNGSQPVAWDRDAVADLGA